MIPGAVNTRSLDDDLVVLPRKRIILIDFHASADLLLQALLVFLEVPRHLGLQGDLQAPFRTALRHLQNLLSDLEEQRVAGQDPARTVALVAGLAGHGL